MFCEWEGMASTRDIFSGLSPKIQIGNKIVQTTFQSLNYMWSVLIFNLNAVYGFKVTFDHLASGKSYSLYRERYRRGWRCTPAVTLIEWSTSVSWIIAVGPVFTNNLKGQDVYFVFLAYLIVVCRVTCFNLSCRTSVFTALMVMMKVLPSLPGAIFSLSLLVTGLTTSQTPDLNCEGDGVKDPRDSKGIVSAGQVLEQRFRYLWGQGHFGKVDLFRFLRRLTAPWTRPSTALSSTAKVAPIPCAGSAASTPTRAGPWARGPWTPWAYIAPLTYPDRSWSLWLHIYILLVKVSFQAEIRLIVDTHNALRRRVAKGMESRGADGQQPKAADMFELQWDKQLANSAQRYIGI